MIASSLAVVASVVYPIPPVPLSALCAQADLVAIVEPGPTRAVADSFLASVELDVVEWLEGRAPEPLEVHYAPGMICPEPPRYPEGARVIAFLTEDDEGTYSTVSLSYGTKVLDDDARELYAARIEELFEIRSRHPEDWRETDAFVEWVVRCAERKATRWEGTMDLDGGYGGGYRDDGTPPALYGELTGEQRARLAEVFDGEAAITFRELPLLEAFEGWRSPRVGELLVRRLADDHEEAVHVAYRTMEFLAERWDDPTLRGLLARYDADRAAARKAVPRSKRGNLPDRHFAPMLADFVEHARSRVE